MVWQALFWSWWSRLLSEQVNQRNKLLLPGSSYANQAGAFSPTATPFLHRRSRVGYRWCDR